MKKILIITGIMLTGVVMISCNRDGNKAPGRAYMPDMAYSRAYETYSSTEELSKAGVDVFYVGGEIHKSSDPYQKIRDLQELVENC